jgi:galacturan 1,4-alpha-galacturonidase
MWIVWAYALAVAVFPIECTAQNVCEVPLAGKNGDDTAAILSAFQRCRQNGRVVFGSGTYHVNKVMNTTGLKNVRIELKGKIQACF